MKWTIAIILLAVATGTASAQRGHGGHGGGSFPPWHAPAKAPSIKIIIPKFIPLPIGKMTVGKGSKASKAPAGKVTVGKVAVGKVQTSVSGVPGPNGRTVDVFGPPVFEAYTLRIGNAVIETALDDNGSFRYRAAQTARVYNRTVQIWQGRTLLATIPP